MQVAEAMTEAELRNTAIGRERIVFEDTFPIRLLRDQVLVRLIAPERMTASKLLWIPANARRADHEVFHGVVIATGPGAVSKHGYRTPCDVKPGDRVVFYFFAAEEALAWPDKDHLLISESWIQYREEV